MGKQRKRYSAQFVTDHRVLFLETICVSPVVFLAFAAGETPAPERSRGERGGGRALPMLRKPQKTEGESMLEAEALCDRLPQFKFQVALEAAKETRTLNIRRQCELIGPSRGSYYYQPASESQVNLDLMRMIDEQYTRTPFYGSPRMTAHLRRRGYPVNHKRIEPLMQKMQLEAIYPKKRTSQPALGRKIYPYLLRGLKVTRPVQVWAADITYVRMAHGFVYLVAIIDWFSRYVVAWALSNTMETHFCLKDLKEALGEDRPEIFNTDQGHSSRLTPSPLRWRSRDSNQHGWERSGFDNILSSGFGAQ